MTPVSDAVETYMYAVASRSPQTLSKYQEQLKVFIGFCEERGVYLEQITPKVFREFVETVACRVDRRTGKTVVARTVSEYAGNIKTFLNWCSTYEDYLGCVKPGQLKAMRRPKVEKKVMEVFTPEEVSKIYEACKLNPRRYIVDRDRALISMLFDSGLRATEICTLKVGDIHLSLEDSHIKIMGKGWKEREVGLGNKARMDLHRFMKTWRKGADPEETVFLAYKRVPLNRYSLDQIIYRLKKLGGVERAGGAHMFRRTFATTYLDNGGDIYDLKTLMGHEHLSTTEKYTQNTSRRKARQRSRSVWDTM